MKRTGHWLNVLGLIALTAFAQSAWAATCTSISSARWDRGSTWSCGHIPGSADTVVIASGFTVSLKGKYGRIAALTIDTGGIIDDRGNNLTVSGNITVNGTFGVKGGGGSLISTGNSTISGTGTFADSVLEIWGNATIPATSTLTFTLGGQIDIGPNAPPNATLVIDGTISGAGQKKGNNIIKVHSGSALTLNGQVNAPKSAIKIKGNATVTNNGSATLRSVKDKNASSVWTNAANSSLTLGTSRFQGTLNASANGNTVTYPNGMAPIIPSNSTYFNLSGPTCAQVQAAGLTILGTGPCGGGGGGTGGCIPTTINGVPTPVMGGSGQLQIGNGSTVNGGNGAVAITGSNNTVPVTGATVAATPVLPALTPATFPANNSNTNTSATTIAAGSYNKITTGTAPTTFTGGTYYVNKLNANGPITLGAGTYYINQLNLYANLTVTGVVQIFIGNGFDVRANNVSVNTPGNVANLQVNFYRKAQLDTHGKNGFSFTGLMYAPDATTQIQIDGNGNTITGAVISGGQVQLNNTAIIYGTTQQNQVATMNTTCTGGGGGATVGGFNAFETSTAANATTGLLYTKLGGTPFGFDVVALQTGGTAVASGFAGTVKVELVDYAAAPATCAAAPLIQSVGTLTFAPSNAGRMTTPQATVATAWPNVRVRMTTPATGTATVVACSTDNFAIRPSSFTVTASAVPTLGATIKVGSNFNLTATSNVASGYTGTPAIVPASVFVDGTTTPITATNLVGAFAAATGAAATGTFQYNELGTITLNTDAVLDTTFTSLDQTSGGCVPNSTSNVLSGGKYGCNIGSAVFGPLGRFIPDHFDTVVTQGCNTTGTALQIFTYSGQPFTATITARGAATATPANKQMTKYAGTYAQTTSLTVVPASGTLSPLQALSSDFVSGVATKTLVFTFTTLPSVPAPITVRATDTDGVTSLGATEGAVNVRVGRFSVSNALGADLYPLSVPWAVQYYGASGWITNPDDTCTAVPATSAIGLSNYKGGLSSTSVTAVTLLTAVPATAGNGAGVITLAKPNPKLTSSGSVWVSPPTLPSWLQPGVAGLANFSIFNGAKEFIYMRENY